jgi:hypothetical protein
LLEGDFMKISNSLIKLGLLIAVVVGMGEWSVALAEEAAVPTIDSVILWRISTQ